MEKHQEKVVMRRFKALQTLQKFIKPLDLIIILFSLFLAAVPAFLVYVKGGSEARVLVEGLNGKWTFPVDAVETLNIQGLLGETLIRIEGGSARVLDSPCDNKTCISSGHISKNGEWLACLPNGVFLMIEGGEGAKHGKNGEKNNTKNMPDVVSW